MDSVDRDVRTKEQYGIYTFLKLKENLMQQFCDGKAFICQNSTSFLQNLAQPCSLTSRDFIKLIYNGCKVVNVERNFCLSEVSVPYFRCTDHLQYRGPILPVKGSGTLSWPHRSSRKTLVSLWILLVGRRPFVINILLEDASTELGPRRNDICNRI